MRTLTTVERLRYLGYALGNLRCIVFRLGFNTRLVREYLGFNMRCAWTGTRDLLSDSDAPWSVGK